MIGYSVKILTSTILFCVLVTVVACSRTEYIVKEKPKQIELRTNRITPIYVVEPFLDTVWVLTRDSAGVKIFRAEVDTLWYCHELREIFKFRFLSK